MQLLILRIYILKQCCSGSRVVPVLCQRAAGSSRRSRFVPKFVWMKLILISLNSVWFSSAIPAGRVAATSQTRGKSVREHGWEHVRARERELARGSTGAVRAASHRPFKQGHWNVLVYELSATVIHLAVHHVCVVHPGDIPVRPIVVCATNRGRWGRGRRTGQLFAPVKLSLATHGANAASRSEITPHLARGSFRTDACTQLSDKHTLREKKWLE